MDESPSEQSQYHHQDKRIWLAEDLEHWRDYCNAPGRAIARGTVATQDKSRPGRGVRRQAAPDTHRRERISQSGYTVSDRLRKKPRNGPLRPLRSEWFGTRRKPVLVRNETRCRLCSAQHTAAAFLCRNG